MPAKAGILDVPATSQNANTTLPPSPRHGRESGHPRLSPPRARSMKLTIFLSILTLCVLPFIASPAQAASTLPFVGCASTGMMTMAAPTGKPILLNIPAQIASKLALFAGAYQAVLGPRGWICWGGIGNDVQVLSLAPPGNSDDNGPRIIIETWGNGSGYTTAMSIAGRYFPKIVNHTDVENFLAESGNDGFTVQKFIAPSYPADRLTYLTPTALEFTTPAGETGIEDKLGFHHFTFATRGMINLKIIKDNSDHSYIHYIVVSLPPELSYMTDTILDFSRKCILFDDHASCSTNAAYGPAVPTIP
jgi:hypothetical protein